MHACGAHRLIAVCLALAACGGTQSTLRPAGRDARSIAELAWGMCAGATVIWLVVVGMAVWAVISERRLDERTGKRLVIGGGVLMPTVVLGALLAWGLGRMPELLEPGDDTYGITVTGEQWWWRVAYETEAGTVALANELVLPVGRRTLLRLEAADVIHAFWVPALGGKMDMIPGRTNFLSLEPEQLGTYEGVCAEFCGSSHARMLFDVKVVEPERFEAWLQDQLADARPARTEAGRRGARVFTRYGCGSCHAIRGTTSDGVVGPDLTHVGSRDRVGAGVLPATHQGFRTWLTQTASLKPGVHMPAFGMLADGELDDLASYLTELE